MPRANSSLPRHRRHRKIVKQAKGYYGVRKSNFKAAKDADVISTDRIISMGDKNIKEKRKQFLPKYKITQSLMSKAKDNAIFMHCLPAVRGEEVSEKVIDGNNSVIWQQVENKLHMHKALIWSLLK